MATILIADDHIENRELIITLLSYQGHNILEAANGQEALQLARSEAPDLVITDVLMPMMDGYEFVRQLRSDPKTAHIVVIFYTSTYHEPEARKLAQTLNVTHFLLKPVEPQTVYATVNAALGLPALDEPLPKLDEINQQHLKLMTNKLVEKVDELESANARLEKEIAERKQAEAEIKGYAATLEQRVAERTADLHRTNAELERANRAKDEFLANMSHELRTPLNGILGLTEIMLDQHRGPINEHQSKWLQAIYTSGRHLLDLINDILDISKIEAGKLEIHPEIILVNDICNASLVFVREPALKKRIALDFRPDPLGQELLADPRRLKQILVNLLTNAVKFSSENGNVMLEVHADPERGKLDFVVADTGIGIAPEELKRLFIPFAQVDNSLTRQYEGSGLGLVLVLRLAEMHGGGVEVESEVGVGSRFKVSLPWQPSPASSSQIGPSSHTNISDEIQTGVLKGTAQPASLSQGTILLAEDNEINIMATQAFLESSGFNVIVARSGTEALLEVKEVTPDLILMDIQMPGMGGLEVTRRLRADPRFVSTPIIALTALAMAGDREHCLEAGANEYMSKPFSLRKLLSVINQYLDKTRKLS